MRNGAQGGGDLELRSPARRQQGKLKAPEYIYYGLILGLLRDLYLCTKKGVDTQKKVRDREREDWKSVHSVGDFGVL